MTSDTIKVDGLRELEAALSALQKEYGGRSAVQAMRPAVVHALAADFRTDLTDANVLVRLYRKGFRIVEVPVQMLEREGGTSMHGGFKSLI